MTLMGKSNVEASGHIPKYQITQLRNPGGFLTSPGIHRLNYNPIIWSSPTKTLVHLFIKDTTSTQFAVEGTMGVDLMPEYFRSQRQIIIDTENQFILYILF